MCVRSVLIGLLLMASPIDAVDRFASPSGGSGACTSAGAPCSGPNAVNAVQSGDTLIFLGGSYPSHVGDIEANNVTVRVAQGAVVELIGIGFGGGAQQGGTMTGEHGTLIVDCGGHVGVNGRDGVFMNSDGTQSGFTFKDFEIRNCTMGFIGAPNDSRFQNLHIHHISLDASGNSYCSLYGNYEDSYKCHGIYIGGAGNIFEGLNIHHIEGMGIHYNSDPPAHNVIIRNSQFRVCGGNCIGFFRGGSNVQVYNNIIAQNRSGESFPGSGNMLWLPAGNNHRVYNNTIIGAFEAGIRTGGTGHDFRNNIIMHVGEAITLPDGGSHTYGSNLCDKPGTGCTAVSNTAVGGGQ